MGCAAAPAILSRTTVLRPVSQPRLLATEIALNAAFVASRLACDGLRSGPGDTEPNDGPAARFAAEAARYGIMVNAAFVASRLACDGLRSGPGDSEPNDGPAARFAAEAARYDGDGW